MTTRNYLCFYNNTSIEVEASSSYAAQQAAAKLMNVKESKRYMITPVLADAPVSPNQLPGA